MSAKNGKVRGKGRRNKAAKAATGDPTHAGIVDCRAPFLECIQDCTDALCVDVCEELKRECDRTEDHKTSKNVN